MVSQSHWSESRPIPGAPNDSQESALAATADALHAVWVSGKTLYHARLSDGQWQAPYRFASGEQPALAAGPDGTLHCAFAHWFLGNCEIYYTRWSDPDAWSLPQLVSRTTGISWQPALSVAQDGRVHIAWADTTSGRTTIYYARQQGVAWANAPIASAQGSRPVITAAPTGEVYTAWQDRLASTQHFEILASIYRDDAWELPEIISDNPLHHSISPTIAINPQGSCHILWQEERGGVYVIRHAERLPGGWSPPVDISSLGAGDARLPLIVAANSKGFPQALWLQGAALMHRARLPEVNASWWEEEVACDACVGANSLAACIAPVSGELHAVWSAYEDSYQRRLFHAYRQPLIRYKVFIPIVAGPN